VKTDAYKLISTLNQLRNHFVSTSDWAKQETHLLTVAPEGVAIMKGPIISILTNIGSPVCQSQPSTFSVF
jgi:alpha-amylase